MELTESKDGKNHQLCKNFEQGVGLNGSNKGTMQCGQFCFLVDDTDMGFQFHNVNNNVPKQFPSSPVNWTKECWIDHPL